MVSYALRRYLSRKDEDGTDIGHDIVRLEAPVVRSSAAEAGLHLVRDAHTSRLADNLVDLSMNLTEM